MAQIIRVEGFALNECVVVLSQGQRSVTKHILFSASISSASLSRHTHQHAATTTLPPASTNTHATALRMDPMELDHQQAADSEATDDDYDDAETEDEAAGGGGEEEEDYQPASAPRSGGRHRYVLVVPALCASNSCLTSKSSPLYTSTFSTPPTAQQVARNLPISISTL